MTADIVAEVTGLAEAVRWEVTRPEPDWPAVRQLADQLFRAALQAPVDGEEQPASAPATGAGVDSAASVSEAHRQLDDVERTVSREPCDLSVALELAGDLAGTAGVVLLILRSLAGGQMSASS